MKKNAGWRPLVALSFLCPGLAFGQPLPGAPDDLVNDAIPDDPYEIDGGAFLDGHPESPQVPFSVNTALVQFEDGTTVQQANDLLSGLGGELVGGISGEDGFAPATAIVRFPTSTHQEMDAVVAALQQDVTVLAAERDVALGEASLPRVTSPPGATTPADWVWDATPTGGNAGLEMMRVPSLWAFNDSVHKVGRAHPGVRDRQRVLSTQRPRRRGEPGAALQSARGRSSPASSAPTSATTRSWTA